MVQNDGSLEPCSWNYTDWFSVQYDGEDDIMLLNLLMDTKNGDLDVLLDYNITFFVFRVFEEYASKHFKQRLMTWVRY